MVRPAAKELTERELEVMHVFWKRGELSASEARDHLAEQGIDRAYVTVANLVRLLVEKGFLEQTNDDRPFQYRAGSGVSRRVAKPRARSGRAGVSRLARRAARACFGTKKTHRKRTCCPFANPEGAGMSHLITSLAWCWMQILLVAAAAIGLSLLVLRRSPTAGATIAWSGVVATLALTGLAFVPLPTRATASHAWRAGRQPIAQSTQTAIFSHRRQRFAGRTR